MTKKYKVEFKQSNTYVFDILAENEEEAKTLARAEFDEAKANDVLHYHENRDEEVETGNVYDVSGTDDPFSLPLYHVRVQQLISLGCTTSDAQGVADAELERGLIVENSDKY